MKVKFLFVRYPKGGSLTQAGVGDEGSGFLFTEALKPWGSGQRKSPAAAFGAHQGVARRPQCGVSGVTGVTALDHYSVLRGRHCREPHLQMGKTEKLDNSAKVTQGDVTVAGGAAGFR